MLKVFGFVLHLLDCKNAYLIFKASSSDSLKVRQLCSLKSAETAGKPLCPANVSEIIPLSHKLLLQEDQHLKKCYDEKLPNSTINMLDRVNGLSDKQ